MSPEPNPRALELASEEPQRFRRPAQPVEVRQRRSWKRNLLIGWRVFAGAVVLTGAAWAASAAHAFFVRHSMFRLGEPDAIEVVGHQHVPASVVQEIFRPDGGQSVFRVPLEARRRQVEEIPWVEAAIVQRLMPNRLRVSLRERAPVAYLRQQSALQLVDAHGVILEKPEGATFSFPVVTGLSEAMKPEERQARLALYREFLADLDRDGRNHAQQVSEVDLGDPDNLRAVVLDPGGTLLVYFGRGRYQEKFQTLLEHRHQWQNSPEPVHSVDLRYRGQIVLNPENPR